MQTDSERTERILRRTAQLRRDAQRKRSLCMDAGCVAACLALVLLMGFKMPDWTSIPVQTSTSLSGAASMVVPNGVMGYVLIGLLSFLLGVCLTILLYRLHRHQQKQTPPEDHHEL